MPRYEYINPAENARKFYEIRLVNVGDRSYQVKVWWGRIGAAPTNKVHSFTSYILANSKYQELIRQKTMKGYRQTNPLTAEEIINAPKLTNVTIRSTPIQEEKKEEKPYISDPRVRGLVDELLGGDK